MRAERSYRSLSQKPQKPLSDLCRPHCLIADFLQSQAKRFQTFLLPRHHVAVAASQNNLICL